MYWNYFGAVFIQVSQPRKRYELLKSNMYPNRIENSAYVVMYCITHDTKVNISMLDFPEVK